MRIHEIITEEIRIKLSDSQPAKDWIKKVYDLYPGTWQNNHVMVWGEGDDQQICMFELEPSMTKRGAVEVKWFQAYPLRTGVGTRGMAELQKLARADGISLTLFPWDKGQVSKAALTKFYKRQGYKPVAKGAKSMYWEPELHEAAYPWTWRGNSTMRVAVAYDSIGTPIEVYFMEAHPGIIEIGFTKNYSYRKTNDYDGQRTLSTVRATISDYIKNWQPKAFIFTGSKGRENVYSRMIARYAQQMGYRSINIATLSPKLRDAINGPGMGQLFVLRRSAKVDEAELDPRGWGSTPRSVDVDYRGIQVQMRPSMFLKLALPLESNTENPDVARHMEKGGKIAHPFLEINDPIEWETGDFSKDARVTGHEGRNRMTQWIKMKGDGPITVHIFFRNANRRRYVTQEMIEQLSKGVFNQSGRWVHGPLFDPKTAR